MSLQFQHNNNVKILPFSLQEKADREKRSNDDLKLKNAELKEALEASNREKNEIKQDLAQRFQVEKNMRNEICQLKVRFPWSFSLQMPNYKLIKWITCIKTNGNIFHFNFYTGKTKSSDKGMSNYEGKARQADKKENNNMHR